MTTPFLQPNLWSQELNAGNLEKLLECYAEDAILFATFHAEPITIASGIRDYFVGFLARDGAGVKFNESTIKHHFISENAYISTGLYEFFYLENGEVIRHPARFSYIVEVDIMHKIMHHHSSIIPS
ncbi:hypothetical protein N9H45_05950 [Opitutales bacterium]|nr:hypothetical protein [Opitutales bacterium]